MSTQSATHRYAASSQQGGDGGDHNHQRQDASTCNLRARVAVAQVKLSLIQLRRCHDSERVHRALDNLCGGLDAALSTLERLDFSRASGDPQ